MGRSSGLLALAVAVAWLAVYIATQVVTQPALDAGWTVAIGIVVSSGLILGYPSALRGPRLRSRAPRRDGPGVSMAVVGRNMPLRSGLTSSAADRTVRLLRPVLSVDSVAITDLDGTLAFVGPGKDHHDNAELGPAAERVLATGRSTVVRHARGLDCEGPNCPLANGVVAPLTREGNVVGLLQAYRTGGAPPAQDLVEGVAGILSLHLDLAELERERQLASDAKLDALRAQINPHFLFNTLNTIASRARTDPDSARQLLLRLSDFFRYSIRQHGHFAEFGQEYFFVRTYLELEQARFGDRLTARYDVDPQVLGVQVPVLIIQPLIENAVKHGIVPKVGTGTIWLRCRVDPLARITLIQVRDNGVGMDSARLSEVLTARNGTTGDDGAVRNGQVGDLPISEGGIGLHNITERLTTLFGDRYQMDVRSAPSEGTTVDLKIPLR